MSNGKTAMALLLEREHSADECHDIIDRWVSTWHDSDSWMDLHEWLGMTRGEYAGYVERPESILSIVAARRSPG